MEGANDLVMQRGKLLVESFESAAKEWAIESASEEGSRHFLKKFNSFKKRKKELTNYLTSLEGGNAILARKCEQANLEMAALRKDFTTRYDERLQEIRQLQSDKREIQAANAELQRQRREAQG